MMDHLLRSLPTFKGKQRLARLLLRKKIASGEGLTVTGKWGCVYNLPNVQENIGFEILINGIYEEETINFICKRIEPGGVFLDVGANIGAITIPVSKQRKDIDVISLEAAPWIFDYLNQNVIANQINKVKTINKAISDRGGMQVDFFSPQDKFGKGSMAPVFTTEAITIETITLDQLTNLNKGRSIDFIKVDVEGFEGMAFKGGSEVLSGSHAPAILFEFVDWAEQLAGETPGNAQGLLLNYGYKLYLFDHGKIGAQLKNPVTKGSYMIFGVKEGA